MSAPSNKHSISTYSSQSYWVWAWIKQILTSKQHSTLVTVVSIYWHKWFFVKSPRHQILSKVSCSGTAMKFEADVEGEFIEQPFSKQVLLKQQHFHCFSSFTNLCYFCLIIRLTFLVYNRTPILLSDSTMLSFFRLSSLLVLLVYYPCFIASSNGDCQGMYYIYLNCKCGWLILFDNNWHNNRW